MKKTFLFIAFMLFIIVKVSSQSLVALTFDDGPNCVTTPKVLDKLKKYNIPASFFLIGKNINKESAKMVKKAFDMGCDIENHSKSHPHMSTLDADSIKKEIRFTSNKIKKIIGKSPDFFRPPFIDVSQTMFDNIGLTFISGLGAKDWLSDVTSEQRAKIILDNVKDGNVILLHDFEGNDATVNALDIIIPELKKRGFEFVTISQLFKRKNITPQKGVVYSNVLQIVNK